ncbi:MAG: F0F1 ATP synthase subunit epsilon [Melioribacteraceae bacterium]|nr:F0F1 ATP synthase subunit epsilon [Melioribacteraceae bacterium]
MKELSVEIITPSSTVFKGTAKSVSVPGSLGNFQILFNHAPILSSLDIGKIKIVDMNDKSIEFATSGGTVEVNNNHVLIVVDSAENKDDIDIERAREAFNRAKERISSHKSDVDLSRAELALQRALNRIKFVEN